MGKKQNITNTETLFQMFLGIIAILAVKSLFDNDNSRILSKKGSNMLSDDKKMKELDRKLRNMESNKENEIFI